MEADMQFIELPVDTALNAHKFIVTATRRYSRLSERVCPALRTVEPMSDDESRASAPLLERA